MQETDQQPSQQNFQPNQQQNQQLGSTTGWRAQLQSVVNHLRRFWLRYFLLTLAVLLVVSAIITAITPTSPEEQPVTTSPISSGVVRAPSSATVNFTNRDIELPETLPIYQAASPAQDAGELAAALAQQLNIPKDPSPYLDNVWTNYETNRQISYQAHSGQITYSTFQDTSPTTQEPEPPTGEPFNTEAAFGAAENFLAQLTNFPELNPQESQIVYLRDEEAVETGSAAEIMVIPFNFELNGYPVFFAGNRNSYVKVQVNKQYQVVKAEFFPPPPTPEEVGSRAVKSLDQAAEEIAEGNVTVITAGSSTGEIALNELSQLRITNTSLEYRFSPDNGSYLPYFRFAAEGTATNQEPTSLTLIMPAIATTNPATASPAGNN